MFAPILPVAAGGPGGGGEPLGGRVPEADEEALSNRERAAGGALLAVSHPSVVSVNQEVYRELARRGWRVTIVLPRRWRHPYAEGGVTPQPLAGMEGALRTVPVAFRGAPQRHFYLALPGRLLAEVRPDVTFLEAEPYSIVASQWRRALKAKGIPFGVQIYENIDRPLPRAVRRMRSRVLADAAFVAARSETAGRLACAWGARGLVGLAPPAVPGWESPARGHGGAFTIGYAGRLVASKGLMDLLAAARMLGGEVELRFIGDGELKGELERRGREAADGLAVRVLDDVAHEEMASAYASLDVLVLPSRTTPTWKEQFGRVIVEALWCGVPVVGSDSGEIPWLIGLTGGGMVFPEGDVGALAERLRTLRADPGLRERLASSGRGAVERLFSIPAAADSLERLLLAAMRGDEEGAAGG